MSSYYTVPTTDKSLGSVKSTVLATGVSLLFIYLVLVTRSRSTTAFRPWSLSSSIAKKRNSTK